ncbi:MAG: hypothetical protein ACO2OQ_02445 [Thermofilaceae archaeon]
MDRALSKLEEADRAVLRKGRRRLCGKRRGRAFANTAAHLACLCAQHI